LADDEARPFLGEASRRRCAEPGAGRGDARDPFLELPRHRPSSSRSDPSPAATPPSSRAHDATGVPRAPARGRIRHIIGIAATARSRHARAMRSTPPARLARTAGPLPVVIVAFPDAQILDVTGPLEVFSMAHRPLGPPTPSPVR